MISVKRNGEQIEILEGKVYELKPLTVEIKKSIVSWMDNSIDSLNGVKDEIDKIGEDNISEEEMKEFMARAAKPLIDFFDFVSDKGCLLDAYGGLENLYYEDMGYILSLMSAVTEYYSSDITDRYTVNNIRKVK